MVEGTLFERDQLPARGNGQASTSDAPLVLVAWHHEQAKSARRFHEENADSSVESAGGRAVVVALPQLEG